jgi:formylglycine-generating enzyme required for sulfatase activity
MLAAGQINQAMFDAAVAVYQAQLKGGGAIAQGTGAKAMAHSVDVQGNYYGDVNLGQIFNIGVKPGATDAELRRGYLARLLIKANQLPLTAGDAVGSQVRLVSVYTALLTQQAQDNEGLPSQVKRMAGGEKAKLLSAVDQLNLHTQVVLLGGPGSGKSTFVNFVAMCMAGELLGKAEMNLATLTAPISRADDDDDQERDKPEPQPWAHGALLPVHVVLRDFASQLPPPGHAVGAQALWQFIEGRLTQDSLTGFAPALHQELLSQGGLVLLDGLDEVPDAMQRRQQIKTAVQEFATTFSKCRFVVTSRTYAYHRQSWQLEGFHASQLLPFTRAQITGFVDAWYAHMVQLLRLTAAAALERADVLKQEVARNARIRDLARQPLLLTLMAQLQTKEGGSLPRNRQELYEKSVDMLLTEWEKTKAVQLPDGKEQLQPSLTEWLKADREDIRRQLNRLAFEAHRDQPSLVGSADIAAPKLLDALLRASKQRVDVQVKRLEEYLRDRAGLLSPQNDELYQFPHRTFQEYLAACHLTDDDFPNQLATLARQDPNRWREVALLAAAKAAKGTAQGPWNLADFLCPAGAPDQTKGAAPEADHWGALLAGQVLHESANLADPATPNAIKLARVREWQRVLMRRNTLPAVERALAGRTLATLGDMRPEVMTLDGMHFCLVPAGPFVMGDDRLTDDERPQHRLELPYTYFIARFPVTVAQWCALLKISGRAPDDADSVRGDANRPVTDVTWHDALHFCTALTQHWRGRLPPGFEVALPSEPEWEKAARGGERIPTHTAWLTLDELAAPLAAAPSLLLMANPFPNRSYPWGSAFDADNTNVQTEAAIGQPSAVGCFASGASPYQCEDMAGNVWEWTRSLWGKDWSKPEFKYPYLLNDAKREKIDAGDGPLRVVRGGSWSSNSDDARCAVRNGDRAGNRDGSLGFRVVLRSSPVGFR